MTYTLLIMWLIGSDWVYLNVPTDSPNEVVCLNKGREVEIAAKEAGVDGIRWTCVQERKS